jgi:hypothetical protein
MGKFKRTKDRGMRCPICTMRYGRVLTKAEVQNPKLTKDRDICFYRDRGKCTYSAGSR